MSFRSDERPARYQANSRDWQVVKAKEDYCLRHEIPFPDFNRFAGRPIMPYPLFDRLKARGAVFEEVYGHERPRWFPNAGVPQRDHDSFRRYVRHDLIGNECRAVRDAAGIMDITAFCKLEVGGRDAASFLDRVIPNRLPSHDGGIILSHFLNGRGRIELEATVVRLARDRFYIVAAAFFEQRLIDHLNRVSGNGESITITNLSDAWAALAVSGPLSGSVLAATTSDPLDNQRFPWLSSRSIVVSGHRVPALRLSYAGELGWELHGPWEVFPAIHDALIRAGSAGGIVDYRSFAMNSMRLEKGSRPRANSRTKSRWSRPMSCVSSTCRRISSAKWQPEAASNHQSGGSGFSSRSKPMDGRMVTGARQFCIRDGSSDQRLRSHMDSGLERRWLSRTSNRMRPG